MVRRDHRRYLNDDDGGRLGSAVDRERPDRPFHGVLYRRGLALAVGSQQLKDVDLPDGTMVTMIGRDDEMIILKGDTVLEDGDRVTILGRPEAINELRARFGIVVSAAE